MIATNGKNLNVQWFCHNHVIEHYSIFALTSKYASDILKIEHYSIFKEKKMKQVIYYFSGTGNSLRAAIKIAERLGNTELISMRNNPDEVSAEDCGIIGFVYPVYHWTMPKPAVEFVKALKINPKAYIFAISMPSFINGYACEKLSELLTEKGASLNYGQKVNSVANYILVYPPMPFPRLTVPMTERRLNRFAEDIAMRKNKPYPKAGVMVRVRRDKMMTPYLELQKYADYPFTVSDKCISCGLCSQVCPCKNIIMENGTPSFQHHCAHCMACVVFCPERAIGYDITAKDKKLLSSSSNKTKLVKLMGLPAKRKRYHNPYITAADLIKNSIWF